ncbi:PH domain-containing protein [Candidatus Saccharibacteria bacterium]|nr:PH domain-containing protein [Candidatus Saccharibacteria bacterium]
MAKNSKNQLPGIALEKGEHLVLVIKRSKLIPVGFWAGAFLCSAILIAASILVNGGSSLLFNMDAASRSFFLMIILVVLGTIWIATLISTHVYLGNCRYVTNKRLIQNTVNSLFSSSTNVIDLVAVEDVSFKQAGIFEHFFSIGTLRMSTIGSETPYTFTHVDTPTDELETITHLVHIEKGEASDACPTDSLTALRNAGRVIRSAAQNNAGNTPANQNENLEGATIVAANTAIINPAAGTVSVEPTIDPTANNAPDTSSNTFNTPNTLS